MEEALEPYEGFLSEVDAWVADGVVVYAIPSEMSARFLEWEAACEVPALEG